MKDLERAREMYNNPEKFGFKGNEIKTMRDTLASMYPDTIFTDTDNGMLEETIKYLDKMEDTPKLKVIKAWLSGLKFPNNEKDTNRHISIALKALKLYSVFHKGTDETIAFLKSIQIAEPKTYEELYNSFSDSEREMTDAYYKKLFESHKPQAVPMTDEEREAIKRGAQLLKDFKHPELYKILEKYFPKK
jgi:hypothetical protein